MKYVSEYRRAEQAQGLLRSIEKLSTREVSVMEICGTHTHAFSKYGIRGALPARVKLISGPGCPVCVTSESDVAQVVRFARENPRVIVATFGDMLRVPGGGVSLERVRAEGSDIRVVYSPLDAVRFASENPKKEVLLFAVGFETTTPTVAASILSAREMGLRNFSVMALPKLTPPAMKALLDSGEVRLHGFICPGHVTAVIGSDSYAFLAREYGSPCVVAGFEPIDAIHGLHMIIKQLEEGRADIEVQYDRVVRPGGNKKAQAVLSEVFETADAEWRGIGTIPGSGLVMRPGFDELNAFRRFDLKKPESITDPAGCVCGDILKGISPPTECALFGGACTPENPVGPCMVSSEGTCAAYYRYGQI